MKSILDNRPALHAAVWQVAETAGYLWEKGWAERNGGNITVNVTEYIDDEIRPLPAICEPRAIGTVLPHLKGCWFYCKGTQKRMRDLARDPMANGSIIRITDDCAHYEIVADQPVAPTSELPSHLSVHNYLLAKGSPYRASLHTHPIELVAMTHCRKFMEKDVATRLLWSMIPETKAFCPRGLGMVPYLMPSGVELADATIKAIDDDYDVVMWEKHGVFAVDTDIMSAFDQVDVLNKAALIYIAAKNMGFEPVMMLKHQAGFNFLCYFLSLDVGEDSQTELLSPAWSTACNHIAVLYHSFLDILSSLAYDCLLEAVVAGHLLAADFRQESKHYTRCSTYGCHCASFCIMLLHDVHQLSERCQVSRSGHTARKYHYVRWQAWSECG